MLVCERCGEKKNYHTDYYKQDRTKCIKCKAQLRIISKENKEKKEKKKRLMLQKLKISN